MNMSSFCKQALQHYCSLLLCCCGAGAGWGLGKWSNRMWCAGPGWGHTFSRWSQHAHWHWERWPGKNYLYQQFTQGIIYKALSSVCTQQSLKICSKDNLHYLGLWKWDSLYAPKWWDEIELVWTGAGIKQFWLALWIDFYLDVVKWTFDIALPFYQANLNMAWLHVEL